MANQVSGKASSDSPALKPYRGKPAVRNLRGGNGNVGIMRSPVRAIALPDGRKVTDAVDGILLGKRYLIHDRDPLFTAEFLTLLATALATAGVESVKLPPRSPNLNAYAERFVRSIKESCLERLILFGEKSLWTAVQNFVAHYHSERNHQGLGNRLILPDPTHLVSDGVIQCRKRLGGTLNYYYRAAA